MSFLVFRFISRTLSSLQQARKWAKFRGCRINFVLYWCGSLYHIPCIILYLSPKGIFAGNASVDGPCGRVLGHFPLGSLRPSLSHFPAQSSIQGTDYCSSVCLWERNRNINCRSTASRLNCMETWTSSALWNTLRSEHLCVASPISDS